MAEINVLKPLTADDMFRGESKTFSSFTSKSQTDLTWYMVERDATQNYSPATDDMKNLFKSFGLSREDENDWFKAVTAVPDWYNAKRMIICALDAADVGSYIEGNTLRFNFPTGTSANEFVTFYGSSFRGSYFNDGTNQFVSADEYDEGVYGSATALLFPTTNATADGLGTSTAYGNLPAANYPSGWHIPYSGSYDGGEHPNSGKTGSWVVSSTKRSVPHLRASHWPRCTDEGRDTPYGIAFLERGLFIFFDMYGRTDFIGNNASITGGSLWTVSGATFAALTYTGGSGVQNTNANNRQQISFTGSAAAESAQVSYRTVTQAYKMIYFCHAGQNEFNSTTNHTYDHQKGYFRPMESDSIWVTEIALYGDNSNDVLAYAKLSEPVEKSMLHTLTFKVELEL